MSHVTQEPTRPVLDVRSNFTSSDLERFLASRRARLRQAILERAIREFSDLLAEAAIVGDRELQAELADMLTTTRDELQRFLAGQEGVPTASSGNPLQGPIGEIDLAGKMHTRASEEALPPKVPSVGQLVSESSTAPTGGGAPVDFVTPRETPSNPEEVQRIETEANEVYARLEERLRTAEALTVAVQLQNRADLCALRRLRTLAVDGGLLEAVPTLRHLYTEARWDLADAGDRDEYAPLNPALDRLTADGWKQLEEAYSQMLPAFEATDWCRENLHWLQAGERVMLLEAIASVQQSLQRTLNDARQFNEDGYVYDFFQKRLYDQVVDLVDGSGYLRALSRSISKEDVQGAAAELPAVWNRARRAAEGARQRAEKLAEERRTAANREAAMSELSAAVGALDAEGVASSEERIADFRAAVGLIKDAGVPPGKVREVLAPYVHLLDQAVFEGYVRAATKRATSKARKGDEAEGAAIDTAFASDDALPLEDIPETVLKATHGKKALVMGGVPKPSIKASIISTLELSEVVWPAVKPHESFAKHEGKVRKADIVFVFGQWAPTECRTWCRDTARAHSKLFAVIDGTNPSRFVQAIQAQLDTDFVP